LWIVVGVVETKNYIAALRSAELPFFVLRLGRAMPSFHSRWRWVIYKRLVCASDIITECLGN
jgi:hypothetical protein